MLTSIFGALLAFVFWMMAARWYSTSEVGLASALIAGIGFLSSLSLFGLNIGLVRFLPNEEDKRGMINSCFTVAGVSSIALAVIFILGTPLWSPALLFLRQGVRFFLLFIAFTVVSSLFMMQGETFIALRSTKFTFAQQILMLSLRIALLIGLMSFGVLGIFSSWGIAVFIALITSSLFFLRKAQPGYLPQPIIKKRVVNDIARFSLGNYIAEVIEGAPMYILPLMVVNTLGTESSAYFRIAYGVSTALFAIPIAVITSLFAEGSSAPEKLYTNVLKAIKFIFILLVPSIILFLFLGDKILYLFGSEYSENALKMLWVLCISSIPLAINKLYVVVKRVELKLKPIIYVYSFATILVFGGCYVLMGKYGLIGIGIGWLFGQGVVALVVGVLIVKWLQYKKAN